MATISSSLPVVSLNDIPYHVVLDNMIQYIEVKTVCYLIMTNKTLQEIYDDNKIWRCIYNKFTPKKIIDTSIHKGGSHSPGYLNGSHSPLQYWKSNTTIHHSSDKSLQCCCSNLHSLKIDSIMSIHSNQIIVNNRIDTHLLIDDQPDIVKQEYYNYIRDIHTKYNKSMELSTKNLCQNIKHYVSSTLGNIGTVINYRCFKTQVIKKLTIEKQSKQNQVKRYRTSTQSKIEEMNMKILKLKEDIKQLTNRDNQLENEQDGHNNFLQKVKIPLKQINIKNAKEIAIKAGNFGIEYDDIGILPKNWRGVYSVEKQAWYYYKTNDTVANSIWDRPCGPGKYSLEDMNIRIVYEMSEKKLELKVPTNGQGRRFKIFYSNPFISAICTIPLESKVGDIITYDGIW